MKKVLVLGGTGAMGRYLVPKLVQRGFRVDVLTLDDIKSENSNLNYIKGNGWDDSLVSELLKNKYDAIVDFLIYNTPLFKKKIPEFLGNTEQYVYLSSYRVFADSCPITEDSPRLLETSRDKEFLLSDDYSLHKATGEDNLKASGFNNFTIVRPAITYSSNRCQLVTLERTMLLPAIKEKRPVLLPETAKNIEGTMTWGGDVAEMINRLVFNEKALGETFNVTTSEHHKWGEIADYYKDIFGLESKWVSEKEYFDSRTDASPEWRQTLVWQLHFDRLYNRVMDNTKILNATGLKQSDLKTLYDGLSLEKENLLAD